MNATTARRFFEKFTIGDGCWEWQAATRNGYGRFRRGETLEQAHRVSFEMFVGPVPDGLHLDHLCRNRKCVNPRHLEPVTNKENILRGESPTARNARKTHCERGHEYTSENTYRSPTNPIGRRCRPCIRLVTNARERANRARAREERLR